MSKATEAFQFPRGLTLSIHVSGLDQYNPLSIP